MATTPNHPPDRGATGHGPASPGARAAAAHEPGASRAWAITLVVLGALLRLVYVFHHAINGDEPQHLHVAWAWTQGLLPYRDVFDNHSPLFSMTMAPVLAWVGERGDAIIVMRLVMIPIVLASIAAVWVLARRLYGLVTAWWAAAVAMIFPDFVRGSVEYRTDQLWSALWLWSLVALVGGPLGVGRSFVTGLLVGAAMATSMKTSATGAGLVLALIVVALVSSWRPRLRAIAPRLAAGLAGALVVPGLLIAYFASRGALAAMHEQTITFNTVTGLGLWSTAPWRGWLFVPCVAFFVWLAVRLVRDAPAAAIGRRRAVVLVGGGIYWAIVDTLWPLVTREDYLPLYPIAALGLALLALAAGGRLARGARSAPMRNLAAIGAPVLVVFALVAILIWWEPPWRDASAPQRAMLGEVLRLTRPGEFVMDCRGESVFRPRPTPLVLEQISLYRIETGSMKDNIQKRMLATATPVVQTGVGLYPDASKRFIEANYLPVGQWRVAGLVLAADGPPGAPRTVQLRVPGRYTVVTARGPARGSLDGAPVREPRWLLAGPHAYVPAPGEGTAALVWAAAIERGFTPTVLGEVRP